MHAYAEGAKGAGADKRGKKFIYGEGTLRRAMNTALRKSLEKASSKERY